MDGSWYNGESILLKRRSFHLYSSSFIFFIYINSNISFYWRCFIDTFYIMNRVYIVFNNISIVLILLLKKLFIHISLLYLLSFQIILIVATVFFHLHGLLYCIIILLFVVCLRRFIYKLQRLRKNKVRKLSILFLLQIKCNNIQSNVHGCCSFN